MFRILTRKRPFIFLLVFIFLSIFFIDVSGQILYFLMKKKFLWQAYEECKFDVFNIKPFTEFVNDERLVTNKRNFYDTAYEWEIATDSNRFRLGANKYFKNKDNFVFLGDSVPFGWGVNSNQSVPSEFYELLEEKFRSQYGVINAAIPSYSLYQAVKRYEYEIAGKFPVKYVILQIYDPATQFLIWSKKWKKEICWTTRDTLVSFEAMIEKHNFLGHLYKYSFIWAAIQKLKSKQSGRLTPLLDIKDNNAFDFFEQENISILKEFYALLKKDNIILIILPVNIERPIHTYSAHELGTIDSGQKGLLIVIDRLNKILQKFASLHENVYYFDIVAYFNKIGRSGMFIDDCHLSEYGAEKQAEFILDQLLINNLL